jgi:hypothetical protein
VDDLVIKEEEIFPKPPLQNLIRFKWWVVHTVATQEQRDSSLSGETLYKPKGGKEDGNA